MVMQTNLTNEERLEAENKILREAILEITFIDSENSVYNAYLEYIDLSKIKGVALAYGIE
jgi:hypothetical protein